MAPYTTEFDSQGHQTQPSRQKAPSDRKCFTNASQWHFRGPFPVTLILQFSRGSNRSVSRDADNPWSSCLWELASERNPCIPTEEHFLLKPQKEPPFCPWWDGADTGSGDNYLSLLSASSPDPFALRWLKALGRVPRRRHPFPTFLRALIVRLSGTLTCPALPSCSV